MVDHLTTFSTKLKLESDAEKSWFERHLSLDGTSLNDPTHFAMITPLGLPPNKIMSFEDSVKPLSSEAKLFHRLARDNGEDTYDFDWSFLLAEGGMHIWFHCEDSGSPYQLACVIHAFFKAMRPKGNDEFFIYWAATCSDLHTDQFGGGTVLATRHGVGTCAFDEQQAYARNHIVNPWMEPL